MAQIMAGHKALAKLAQALGIDGRFVRRMVIDIAVDAPVKVYFQAFGTDKDISAVADLLTTPDVPVVVETARQVGVDEKGFVIWEKA